MIALRRSLIAAAAALATLALVAQVLADGLFGSLAAPHSLPHRLAGDWAFDAVAATGLDRLVPVRLMLARAAIVRAEPQRAVALLAPLAPGPDVADLRGRAALAAGDTPGALRDFAAAGDFVAATPAIDALAEDDPRAALAVVRDFERRLDARTLAPEIAAEAAWREGTLAASAAERDPAGAAPLYREALDAFARALAQAPNEEKYLLNYAFAALRSGATAGAYRTYVRATEVVPDSLDAYVGAAVSAAALDDCAGARAAMARARILADEQRRAADPAAAGFASGAIEALARCGG